MTETLLRTLREQVANDRVSEALETVDELQAAFAADRARTAADDTLATALRYRSDGDSPAAAAADAHHEAATELEQRRVELHEAIIGYVGGETPPTEVVGRIDATLGAHETLADEREALRDAAGGASIGTVLHLGPIEGFRVPKGDSVAVATELRNLGTDGTDSLKLTADADDTVSTELSPNSLAGLAAGEETAVGVDVGGLATGTARVRVTVEGQTVESTTFRVEVLDKTDYLSEALSIAEQLLADVDGRTGPGNGASFQGLRNRLDEIVRRLERIRDRIDSDGTKGKSRGKDKSVDNRIGAVSNRFESVANTVENREEVGLDARVVSEYVRRCRDAIDLLESAVAAEE